MQFEYGGLAWKGWPAFFMKRVSKWDCLAVGITKAEYRRYRAAGIPSWGEAQTVNAKASAHDPERAARWAARAMQARMVAQKMERERMESWKRRQAQAVAQAAM